MKNKFFLSAIISLIFFSCGNPIEQSSDNKNDCTEYACPMHPDKTSTVPAQCPECGMNMDKLTKKEDPGDSSNTSSDEKK